MEMLSKTTQFLDNYSAANKKASESEAKRTRSELAVSARISPRNNSESEIRPRDSASNVNNRPNSAPHLSRSSCSSSLERERLPTQKSWAHTNPLRPKYPPLERIDEAPRSTLSKRV